MTGRRATAALPWRAWRDASVLAARAPGRTLGGMVPDPALLHAGRTRPSLVRADGRPQPAFRDRLRTIPSWRNAWSVVSVWLQTVVVVGLAVWWGNPIGYVARVPADGAHAGAARGVDARGRAPAAVREPARSTTSSAGGSSATRRSRRPTRTGACTWRTTVRSSGPTSPTSRSTPATRSPARARPAQARARRDRAAPASSCSAASSRGFRSSDAARAPHAVEASSRCRPSCSAPRSLVGYWWVYPVFWVAPFLTVWRVINRLRSIAEHGGMDASTDRRAHHAHRPPVVVRPLRARAVPHRLAPRPPRRRRACRCDTCPRYHASSVRAGYVTAGARVLRATGRCGVRCAPERPRQRAAST